MRFDTIRKYFHSNLFCSVIWTHAKKFYLPKISAEDPDFGPSGDIAFDIQSVSNNGGEKFAVKHDNGENRVSILCIGTIQKGDTYVIMVRVSDKGGIISRRRYGISYSKYLAVFNFLFFVSF